MSNFAFLSPTWPMLSELGDLAERNLHIDPNTTLLKLRIFGELLAKYLLAYEQIDEPANGAQVARLHLLETEVIIPDRISQFFQALRKAGNRAAHEGYGTVEAAQTHLHIAHRLAVWFRQTYGDGEYDPQDFVRPSVPPPDADRLDALNRELAQRSGALEAELRGLQAEIQSLRAQAATPGIRATRRRLTARAVNRIWLTEAETRLLIDEQLHSTGWPGRYSKPASLHGHAS